MSVAAIALLVIGLILANGSAILSDHMTMTETVRWVLIGTGVVLMILALIVQKRSNIVNHDNDKAI